MNEDEEYGMKDSWSYVKNFFKKGGWIPVLIVLLVLIFLRLRFGRLWG